MAKCVIFCAGEFCGLAEPLHSEDFVIAADGGLTHLQGIGVVPNEIIGDFDSLGYVPENATVFPVEKDDTDSILAVRRGLSLGYREFVIYGSLGGGRLDHTLANLQTLAFLAAHGATGHLVGNDNIVTLVQDGALRFPATAEGIVSVFCLGQDAEGVTIRGLQYPLENGTITSRFPLGVSNHFMGENAEISVKSGSLWVIYPRSNGICR